MKTKMRTRFNVWMTAILALMGFGSFGCVMYGVPEGDLTFEGKVVNEEQEALEGIMVVRRGGWTDGIPQMHWNEYADTLYTNSEGEYYKERERDFPLKYHMITVKDPSGEYKTQDTVVTVRYKGGLGWYEGKATIKLNFTLKKK